MSADVVSLADARRKREPDDPHVTGPAVCLACGHTWTFVAPVGCCELDCPKCGATRGVSAAHVTPQDDERMWVCSCGGWAFCFPQGSRPMCLSCGTEQVFD